MISNQRTVISKMKAIREYSLTLSLLIGILVMSAVVLLWRSGWLQLLELGVYDRMLRHQSRSHTGPSPVVIVGITDEDMTRWKYGWPLTDKVLAELLERIESAGPRAIGVDLYRDVPVPASGDELRLLEDILNRHANLVFIYSLDAKTPPPSVLAGKPAQLGFNDVPGEDTIRATIRREPLFMSNGQEDVPSFGFQLARLYLERDGIFPEPDPRAGPSPAGKSHLPPV